MLLCFGKKLYKTPIFFIFFLSKIFFKKCNGIRFLRNDDRSEVGMCMEWDYFLPDEKLTIYLKLIISF
jgi:hypothetical protein